MKFLFYGLYICNLLLILGGRALPASVAVHFSLSGTPNQWMNRETFLLSWGIYCTVMALAFGWSASGKIPLSSRFCNLPHKQYWLHPSRKDRARKMLSSLLYQGGSGLFLFLGGVFLLLLHAHQTEPPRLALPLFFLLLGGFFAAFIPWIFRFYRAFRKPKNSFEE